MKKEGTVLHVACLPFPSYQGTQAAIASMLRASAQSGRETHLLAYAHGAYEIDAPFEVHRVPDFPKVHSLRSGPSWGKLVLDARCITKTRRLAGQLEPEAVVAHHIEAALAALAARVAPVYYVAHTSLQRELPVYFPTLPAPAIASIARTVERQVCSRAAGVAAVAPSLVELLDERAVYLPVPWARAPKAVAPSKREARVALGLPLDAPVCLYAGNLDRYQGWEHLVGALVALRRVRPNARVLIATESDPAPARLEAERAHMSAAVHFCRLDGERARQLAHAASDLTWVPRRTEGGLPIKMLDAFARGLPTVAMRRATAALPMRNACMVVPDDDPHALAQAANRLLEDDALARDMRRSAFGYLEAHHSIDSFAAGMRKLLEGELKVSRAPKPSAQLRPAERVRLAR